MKNDKTEKVTTAETVQRLGDEIKAEIESFMSMQDEKNEDFKKVEKGYIDKEVKQILKFLISTMQSNLEEGCDKKTMYLRRLESALTHKGLIYLENSGYEYGRYESEFDYKLMEKAYKILSKELKSSESSGFYIYDYEDRTEVLCYRCSYEGE